VRAETEDSEEIIARVAALDVGKADLVCCVRVPDEDRPGRRMQEVATYSTMTRSLLGMADRLRCLGVTRVVMEATSDYWKCAIYLLEAHGFEAWLMNARDVKHLPGRPKTDKLDAVWLCKVAERQMIRPSFVPPRRRRPAVPGCPASCAGSPCDPCLRRRAAGSGQVVPNVSEFTRSVWPAGLAAVLIRAACGFGGAGARSWLVWIGRGPCA
jgi:hypothetical protein